MRKSFVELQHSSKLLLICLERPHSVGLCLKTADLFVFELGGGGLQLVVY